MLDIGSGAGLAARAFHKAGWDVTATSLIEALYRQSFDTMPEGITSLDDVDICDMRQFEDDSFDAIWCAHVLEHVLDVGRALSEVRRILKPEGRLFLSVPPFKHQVVGGHVSTGWNVGQLAYVLAVAGFDLSDASLVRHGYNVFADVRCGQDNPVAGELTRSNGDIELLAKAGRFPPNFRARQRFNGKRKFINWEWRVPPTELPVKAGEGSEEKAQMSEPDLSNLKISFIIPWITQGRGGTENVGHMMANAMHRRGHTVQILTFDDQRGASQWPLDDGIALVHLPEADTPEADMQMSVEMARFAPDLIVGLHMNRTFSRYVRVARKLGVPIVVSEHIDPRFPKRLRTFNPEEREVAFSGAAKIHLLVEAFRETLPDCLQSRIEVIPNTVTEPKELATPGATEGMKYLVSVARLVPRKNMRRLVEVFNSIAPTIDGWTLRIVGDGPRMEELKSSAENGPVANRIEFVGHVGNAYPYYRNAHLFVLPSLFEGFPMSSLEAMAHGLPLVGYKVCNGINLQIRHEENGLLSSGGQAVGSLADDLERLMRDDALRARMGEASREIFMKEYSNRVIETAWEDLFLDAVEDGAAPKRPDRLAYLSVKLDEMTWGDDALIKPIL